MITTPLILNVNSQNTLHFPDLNNQEVMKRWVIYRNILWFVDGSS